MTVEEFFRNTPMAPLTRGALVEDETAAFICPDEEKRLLYEIGGVLSVKSYDGALVYVPERDYTVRGGRLLLPPGSAIPAITPEVYYSEGAQPLLKVRKPDGSVSPCFFTESNEITRHQVRVTYTHADKWSGFTQPHTPGRFERFLRLLEEGRGATVLFYGDSITYGANASFLQNTPPHRPPYPMLLTDALARLYGCGVRFLPPEAENAYAGPAPELHAGTRGMISYVNTAVGGWDSKGGKERLGTHITPQVKKYGCDLFVLAFGMNDGGRPPEETAENCEAIVRHVLSLSENASVLLVSTMLPNPKAVNGWFANQPLQEPALLALAEKLRNEGVPCDVARVTSASEAVLKRKEFIDYTGNNINHPNDFFSRVYAQTALQTLVGYDTPAFAAG